MIKGIKIIKTSSLIVFVLLGILLLIVKLPYFAGETDAPFFQTKQDVIDNLLWRTALYLHVFSGIIATLSGVVQFAVAGKKNKKIIHRIFGRTYIYSILFIACPSAIYLSLYASAVYWLGFWAHARFVLLSFCWFFATYVAYKYFKKGEYLLHAQWMIRSYALTFVDISGRLHFIIITNLFHPEPLQKALIGLWSSFLGNVLLGELAVYLFKKYTQNNKGELAHAVR